MDSIVLVSEEELRRVGYPKGHMLLVSAAEQRAALDILEAAADGEGREIRHEPGGSAANTAVGAARLGAGAAFFGRVARDRDGERFRNAAERAGVRLGAGIAPERRGASDRTGASLVMTTPDGQRTMLTHLGVASEIGPEAFDHRVVRESRFVYLEGYQLTSPVARPIVLEAAREAEAAGATVALTASDSFVVDEVRDVILDLIAGPVGLLFCNLDEARRLTERVAVEDVAAALAKLPATVALTMGAEGSILLERGASFEAPAFPAPVLDTSGAGDLYAAGVLAGLARGDALPEAGRLGAWAAAQVVSLHGPRLPGPIRPFHPV